MAIQENQPLVLKNEWEVKEKDKFTSSAQNLTVTFNKATDEITLLVNNEVYKKLLDIGDIIGVEGILFTTQVGETI